MSKYPYISLHIYIYISMCIYIYTHVCIHFYIYIYIYVYISTLAFQDQEASDCESFEAPQVPGTPSTAAEVRKVWDVQVNHSLKLLKGGLLRGLYRELLGRRVIERRGVFYHSRFVAHPVFPTPANVSCIVQKLRLKIVGLRRTGKN